jgi:hypothetical protein
VNILDLTSWAAIAEIVGTLAVVASLLFVGISLNRNNAVLKATNDNFLYQLQDGRIADTLKDPELASILVKQSNKEELSDVEIQRLIKHQIRKRNLWELAFDRHNEGMLSSEKWDGWNRMFAAGISENFPQEWWSEVRQRYGENFARHVDAMYSND